jgi:hypothetical protein
MRDMTRADTLIGEQGINRTENLGTTETGIMTGVSNRSRLLWRREEELGFCAQLATSLNLCPKVQQSQKEMLFLINNPFELCHPASHIPFRQTRGHNLCLLLSPEEELDSFFGLS